MFEKYDINDLFIGIVRVMYAENCIYDTNAGGILMSGMSGYGYITILKKLDEEEYLDLKDLRTIVTATRNPRMTSYLVDYIEPLSSYYRQDGKQKKVYRGKILKDSKPYYNEVMKNQRELQTKEDLEDKSITR